MSGPEVGVGAAMRVRFGAALKGRERTNWRGRREGLERARATIERVELDMAIIDLYCVRHEDADDDDDNDRDGIQACAAKLAQPCEG
jgi:hypothetical protein